MLGLARRTLRILAIGVAVLVVGFVVAVSLGIRVDLEPLRVPFETVASRALGRAVAIDLGLGASQIFPEDKCAEAWSFTASNGSSVDGRANCNVYFFPRVGLVFSIPTRSAKRAGRSNEREPSKERESKREQVREEPRPAPDRSSGWAVPGATSPPVAGPEPAAPLSEDAAAPAATETPAAAPSDAGDEAVEASSPAAEASSPEPAAEPAPEPAPGTR